MAKILEFRFADVRDEDRTSTTSKRCAEVILFPGVRYEHWGQSGGAQPVAAPEAKERPRQQQRDMLELAE